MIRILIATLLMCSAAAGQSISVSGGRSSFIISGKGTPQKAAEKTQDAFVPVPAEKPAVSVPVKPQPVPAVQARRQWYLVSESWCSHCPAAKARFRAKGWPEKNILTIAECERRFGFRPSHVPFEFGEPAQTVRNTSAAPTGDTTRQFQQRARLPTVNTQWGTIDLETYQRNCNCSMCQGIRDLQRQYRAGQYQSINYVPELPPGQQPTPHDVVEKMVGLISLTSESVHADLGCGRDARICIEAVRQSGCRSIGVEIDPEAAHAARRVVAAEGLSDRIEIICGDAQEFDPASHGVTAITAYLYPDLLARLLPKFQQVRVVATPFHEVPGLSMVQSGDVWIRTKT